MLCYNPVYCLWQGWPIFCLKKIQLSEKEKEIEALRYFILRNTISNYLGKQFQLHPACISVSVTADRVYQKTACFFPGLSCWVACCRAVVRTVACLCVSVCGRFQLPLMTLIKISVSWQKIHTIYLHIRWTFCVIILLTILVVLVYTCRLAQALNKSINILAKDETFLLYQNASK